MKKFILTIATALVTISAFAEGDLGICAGYNNMLEVTRVTIDAQKSESVDIYHGFYAGVEYAFKDIIGDNWLLTPGIQIVGDYGKQNQEVDLHKDGKVWGQEKDFYLQIPVLVSHVWDMDGWSPYIGVDAKFLMGLSSRFTVEKAEGASKYLEDTVINWYARALDRQYNRFNFMLGIAAGTMIGDHFKLSFQYDIGLVNRYKGELATVGYMNESLLTVGLTMMF